MANVKVDIKINTAEVTASLSRISAQLTGINSNVNAFGKGFQKSFDDTATSVKGAASSIAGFTSSAAKLTKSIAIATAVAFAFRTIKNAIGGTITDFKEFETAVVGVSKTTDLSGFQLEDFSNKIEELARVIPVSSVELANLSKVAGQLGVRGTDNLIKFADVGARLASSTNLSAETAVSGLTRIIRLTKESDESIDKLGSALVRLGNTFNANEDQILSASLALSQATSGFRISSGQILALGTAVKEAGLGSEKAATAIAGTITDIARSVTNGGKSAQNFAKLVGLSVSEVADIINEDAGKAFELLITSLGEANLKTTQLQSTLQDLGVSEKRELQVIQSLIRLREKQAKAQEAVNEEYAKPTALINESNKAFATLESTTKKLTEAWTQFSRVLGQRAAPLIQEASEAVTYALNSWTAELKDTRTETERVADGFQALGKDFAAMGVDVNNPTRLKGLLRQITEELKVAQTEYDKLNQSEERLENPVLLAILKQKVSNYRSLQESIVDLIEKQRAYNEELAKEQNVKKPPGRGGPDPDTVAQNIIETEKLLKAFDKSREAVELELAEEKAIREETALTARLENIRWAFGEEEALQTAREANKLAKTKNTEQAITLLTKKELDARKELAKKQAEAEIRLMESKAGTAVALGRFLTAALGRESKIAFAISKAAAIAEAIVNTQVAITKTQAALGPFAPPVVAQIKIQGALAIGTIAATALQGFEDGGIVGGSSYTGDNVVARVNSGEMILNRQQQAQLFNMANQGVANANREIVVHTTVELDGQAIGKSVSRQVADGLKLGEVV